MLTSFRRRTVVRTAAATLAIGLASTAIGAIPTATPVASAAPSGAASLGISAANARDVGGYATRTGAIVATGVVYRSNALNTVTDLDKQKLTRLGITHIIDVRSPNEAAANPDNLPPARYTPRPIWNPDDDFYVKVNRIIGAGPVGQREALGSGRAAQMMRDYYRWMVTDPGARHQIGTTLRDIATATTPLLYHCTSGKDRTGLISAVLLTALGVPEPLVYRDYLASNERLAAGNTAQMAALVDHGLVTDPSLFAPILGVQRDFLAASFDQIRRSYGSFGRYLTRGLGLDASTMKALSATMLRRGAAPTPSFPLGTGSAN
ncbi:tyrosine-protein phosphatase [Gordonia insulae]|uniref:Tyrosine-protein phosphatase n=1 Tax=Gordonia insulae TaxID=2420509 RepID=A0A3G8JN14_9ACTN|nr:tyrosine-protein phosphatase [Gordonia insulae]AZG45985.1 Tyrosine-protein phosphatase [Gordonia insulae]